MKNLLMVAILACVAHAGFSAVTWSVDSTTGNDTAAAADPTHAIAFETIQAAVDAAGAGDTINIAAGVYNKGERVHDESGISSNRVVITKSLTLVGAGRGQTIIEGKKGTGTYAPLGYNAVRCVFIPSAVTGVTLKNLTLRGGATTASKTTEDSNGCTRRGGGIACGADGNWLVDCTVEDCTAVNSGAGYQIRAARTLFRNNYVRNGATGSVNGAISCSDGTFIHCVFIGNGGAALFYGSSNLCNCNCTFAANCATIVDGSTNGNVYLYNCVVDASSSPSAATATKLSYTVSEIPPAKFGSIDNSVTNAAEFSNCVAPALDDCRPIAGSAAIGAGSYKILSDITWGGDYRYRFMDFNGNAITDPGDDKINAGAYQTAVTPAGGLNLFVAREWCGMSVDGIFTRGDCYSTKQTLTNYFRTITYPSQHRYQAVCNGSGLEIRYVRSYFNGVNTRGYFLPIDTTNACWALAAPAGATNLYYLSNAYVSWIDCNTTAETRDGTESKPYKSFKEAISAKFTADYAARVFKVKAGVYTNDTDTSCANFNCRIGVRKKCEARFIAVDGPERTIVCGAPDSSAEDGCGANAVRVCGSVPSGDANAFLHGFTLTGGYTTEGSSATSSGVTSRGAVVTGGVSDSNNYGHWVLTDCIISNNTAGAQVARGVLCARCLFTGNRSLATGIANYGASLVDGYLTACVFRDNAGGSAVLATDAHAVQCTIYDATMPYGYKCNSYNTIASAPSCPYVYHWYGCVLDGFSSSSGTDRLRGDPQFYDKANGDLRVYLTSPAVGFGQTDPAKVGGVGSRVVRLSCGDFKGNPLTFYSDGTTIAGAYQKTIIAVQGAATGGRGISPIGSQIPDAEGKVTFTATETETRNFLGFALNDELVQPASAGTVYTYQVPDPQPTATPVVTALYSTNWYVNASAPDDSASGADAEHPKRTLSGAFKNAIAGDVVHAAEGTYNDGSDKHPVGGMSTECTAVTIETRAVVPEGVSLVADGARERTIIEGAAATHDADDLGNGPDAIRCVYLSKNAHLIGFTVFNGHTATNEGTVANLDDRTTGGVAFYRDWGTASVEDCVITNCFAVRNVAGLGGNWYRCVIVANRMASDFNGIIRNAYIKGCLLTKNIGTPVVYYGNSTKCCTFAGDNVYCDGTSPALAMSVCYGRAIDGCVFATPRVCNAGTSDAPYTFTDCAFLTTGNQKTARYKDDATNSFAGVCIEDDRVAVLDERGAPKPLENPAIDRGDSSLWTFGDTDARGGKRIYNGQIDIGAVEADWCGLYARFLCDSRLIGTEVSTGVVAVTNGVDAITGIKIPEGETMTLAIKGRSKSTLVYRVPITLASGATLTVVRNGEAYKTVTESGNVDIEIAAGGVTTLELSSAGGAATLGKMVHIGWHIITVY